MRRSLRPLDRTRRRGAGEGPGRVTGRQEEEAMGLEAVRVPRFTGPPSPRVVRHSGEIQRHQPTACPERQTSATVLPVVRGGRARQCGKPRGTPATKSAADQAEALLRHSSTLKPATESTSFPSSELRVISVHPLPSSLENALRMLWMLPRRSGRAVGVPVTSGSDIREVLSKRRPPGGVPTHNKPNRGSVFQHALDVLIPTVIVVGFRR